MSQKFDFFPYFEKKNFGKKIENFQKIQKKNFDFFFSEKWGKKPNF